MRILLRPKEPSNRSLHQNRPAPRFLGDCERAKPRGLTDSFSSIERPIEAPHPVMFLARPNRDCIVSRGKTWKTTHGQTHIVCRTIPNHPKSHRHRLSPSVSLAPRTTQKPSEFVESTSLRSSVPVAAGFGAEQAQHRMPYGEDVFFGLDFWFLVVAVFLFGVYWGVLQFCWTCRLPRIKHSKTTKTAAYFRW